jgi:hypothetical protein
MLGFRLLVSWLIAGAVCGGIAAADAAAKPLFGPSREFLLGEEPEEPDFVSFHESFGYSFSPNLVDVPAAELVERRRATLEITYLNNSLGPAFYDNVVNAKLRGIRLSYHVRAGRDFMLTLEAPFYKERLELVDGTQPAIPGTVSALSFEVRHLLPWEVAGFRTAIGARLSSYKEASHPLFTPDDHLRLNAIYATSGHAITPNLRITLASGLVHLPQPEPLVPNRYAFFGLGYELNLFRARHNFVRWIAEANLQRLRTRDYNFYGFLRKTNDIYYNTGLRVRTGVLQVDLALRRPALEGNNGFSIGVVRRF